MFVASLKTYLSMNRRDDLVPIDMSQFKMNARRVLLLLTMTGSACIFLSMALPWTRSRSFLDIFNLYVPGGWILYVIGAACMVFSVIPWFVSQKTGVALAVQVISASIVIFMFLGISVFHGDFFAQFDSGYFLSGVGIIACILELVFSIMSRITLDPSIDVTKKLDGDATLELEKNFYEALNHDIRRTIIRMIGEQGYCTFSEFKATLKVSTGSLYHHINMMLSSLIFQKADKRYYLTPLGSFTFQFMRDNLPYLHTVPDQERAKRGRFPPFFRSASTITFKLYAFLFERNNKYVPALIAIPVVMLLVAAMLGFQVRFFFFTTRYYEVDSPIFAPPLEIPGFLVQGFISWFVVWGLMELLSYGYFKKTGGYMRSLIGTGVCWMPVFVFCMGLFFKTVLLGPDLDLLTITFLVVTQGIVIFMLVTFQMYHKNIKVGKAFSVVLPTHYLAIFFNILLFAFT